MLLATAAHKPDFIRLEAGRLSLARVRIVSDRLRSRQLRRFASRPCSGFIIQMGGAGFL